MKRTIEFPSKSRDKEVLSNSQEGVYQFWIKQADVAFSKHKLATTDSVIFTFRAGNILEVMYAKVKCLVISVALT